MSQLLPRFASIRAFGWLALLLLLATPAYAEVKFQEVTSAKGVTAWLVEDYSVPLITIRFAFDGGTSQDPVGKEGLANLMTYLFDEGAGDLDSDAFQIRLDDAGAEQSFAADADTIYGGMRMLADQRDEAFGLLKLAIQSPRFDQNPIDRMRAQVVSGIVAAAQSPETAAQQQWSEALYGTHPYARRSEGTLETVKSLTADDLRAMHKALFARSNLHVGVVGAIDAETLKTVLDNLFGDLPADPVLVAVPDVTPNLGQDLHIDYDLPQTSISLAFPGIKRDAPDFFAAYLMNTILGGDGFSSRLFDEVREKRGLTYGISSSLSNAQHSDLLLIGTQTRADRTSETLGVMRDVIARMAADGPTDAELASAKQYVIGSYAISELGSSTAIASTLVGLQLKDLGIDYLSRRADLINAVTVTEVKAAAAKLLSAKPAMLILGPPAADAAAPATPPS